MSRAAQNRTQASGRTAARAKTAPVQRRLSAADRRRDILAKSIEYFAQVGFDGGTRELARHLGTTQPLLYRYFPNKDALIQEIYKVVYLDQWKSHWDGLLTDRTRPLRARLQDFYEDYTDVILNPQWMRIYFFAGLKGVNINERYLALVEERILSPIVREFHHEAGLEAGPDTLPRALEIAWQLQGGIFYYGVRRYVYGTKVHVSKSEMITEALDLFFAGYGARLAAQA
ncbi:TetR/AcrR family transcriptional regulator [Aquabacter cavernae]|uniref:TetR/AcrR family transcriptional regulator n=1 Tax=Aquabacter cavernae TaxID=2496029 RepID=UPI000F8D1A9E|nr:TetR/AcrR family transcriptional regulator [Aquabacter cavernae]